MRQAGMRVLLFGLCAACASTQTARPDPNAGAQLPALPEDPLALIVGAPESVAVLRVEELRKSPLFERLRPYIERATCMKVADWDAVLSATQRAALAAQQKSEQEQEWLAVLDGRYTDADARRLLEVALKHSGSDKPIEPAHDTRDASGRFGVTEQGGLAVSLLDSRLLVLGTQAWQRAVLASLDKPAAKFADSPLWNAVGAQLSCSERGACVFWTANGTEAKVLERGLSSAGAQDLGSRLRAADSALALTARDSLSLGFGSQLTSNEAAQTVERGLREWLWQVNLVIRLTGLPAVLDRTRLGAQAAVVRAELDVSPSELDAYEARAKPLVERELGNCNAAAQSL